MHANIMTFHISVKYSRFK